jgi:hypothetical protein
MFKKSKVVLALAALTFVASSSFADKDVITLAKEAHDGIKKKTISAYDHVLRPIPGWVRKSAKNAKDETIFVVARLGDDGQAVGTAFYKKGSAIVTHVVDPTVITATKAAVALVKIPTYDIAWNMVLVPIGDGAKIAWNSDLRDGAQSIVPSERKAGEYLNADMNKNVDTTAENTRKVYDVTAVPVYKGTTTAASDAYHFYIDSFKGN